MIELFINNALCDISDNFAVRINRKFIDPATIELKDAQFSYSISLPITSTNADIFNRADIEEKTNKFNRIYTAELLVSARRVFKGNFKLTNISDTFKGNLYVAPLKTVSDIFGELKLRDLDAYNIYFGGDFANRVNEYNTLASSEITPVIFPLVLYSVLAKVPINEDDEYTARDLYDDTVRLGIQDFPPSINTMQLLKHVFNSRGLTLEGSALSDDRLNKLYQSYSNPADYVQAWNYGTLGEVRVFGAWSSTHNKRTNAAGRQFERGIFTNSKEGENDICAVNLFDSTNAKINVTLDPGANVLYREIAAQQDSYNREWARTQLTVPVSGLYKVIFRGGVKVLNTQNWRDTDVDTDIQHVGRYTENADNDFRSRVYELRLLRDRGRADFNLSNAILDNNFYNDNENQNETFQYTDVVPGAELNPDFNVNNDTPKFCPCPLIEAPGDHIIQRLMVDAKQDSNIIAGFAFGRSDVSLRNINPFFRRNVIGDPRATAQFAKPGRSWDKAIDIENIIATHNEHGYMRYGLVRSMDENPGVEDIIDWQMFDRYRMTVNGLPYINNAQRGTFSGVAGNAELNGDGAACAVVWLEKGEMLTVAAVSEEGRYRRNGMHSVYGITEQEVWFDLRIKPFKQTAEWLKVNAAGKGTAAMNWNEPTDFPTEHINLVDFLPDLKIDDFINDFVKTFNLKLTNINDKTFRLDTPRVLNVSGAEFVDLDGVASLKDRENTPTDVPAMYKLGFKINADEQGYVESGNDGGGTLHTGAINGGILEQKSNFSLNWFKDIEYQIGSTSKTLKIPIISKKDVWEENTEYHKAMEKKYTDLGIRFWYFDGKLTDAGAVFPFGNDNFIQPARVSNVLPERLTLDYSNERRTILTSYFNTLVNAEAHYTEVTAYVSAEQYERLNSSIYARYNGDIYLIAELSGYDPTGRNKTTIKLIKKI